MRSSAQSSSAEPAEDSVDWPLPSVRVPSATVPALNVPRSRAKSSSMTALPSGPVKVTRSHQYAFCGDSAGPPYGTATDAADATFPLSQTYGPLSRRAGVVANRTW
ncbi:hypothetical protein [Spirillospora sp. CA-128828]|uniref:hypothetical protein n=1 Tax=Spirillospora sp. CA-128828 TaxID=3240033 RepID=UPI003D91E74E